MRSPKRIRIAALVVLYYPDTAMVSPLLKRLKEQALEAFVFDNTPAGSGDGSELSGLGQVAGLCAPGRNLGIAAAHNWGIRQAAENGFTHILFLDQDSELERDGVEALAAALCELNRTGVKVAAVGPLYLDRKNGQVSPALSPRWYGVRKWFPEKGSSIPVASTHIIASGALIPLQVFEEVGLMNESLFIDLVDVEWGERASLHGYISYLIPAVSMSHSLGDRCAQIGTRNVVLHSDARNYYIVRNSTFLGLRSGIRFASRLQLLVKVPYYVLGYSFFSPTPAQALKMLVGAVIDGIAGRMGERRDRSRIDRSAP
jgi:rhamnosyltransferase